MGPRASFHATHSNGMGSASSTAPDTLPAGISPEEGAGCLISSETKVHTRSGLSRASSLVGQQFEVWSGAGWTQARVECVGETAHLRVGLSDGSWLECSAAASWPIIKPTVRSTRGSPEPASLRLGTARASPQSARRAVELKDPADEKQSPGLRPITARAPSSLAESKQRSARALDGGGSASDSDVACVTGRAREWVPRIAMNLRPGDKVVTRPIVDPKDLLPTLITVEDARAAGKQHGLQAQGASNLKGIAAPLLTGSPDAPGLTGASLQAFVDGWAEAQGGYLVGPDAAIVELQMLLRRLGFWRTLLERTPANSSLAVSNKTVWLPAEGQARQWVRRLRSTSQLVISVETLAKKAKMYRLVLMFRAPTTVMVGNTMLAVLPSEAPAPAPT